MAAVSARRIRGPSPTAVTNGSALSRARSSGEKPPSGPIRMAAGPGLAALARGAPASTGTVTHVDSPRSWASVAKAPGLTLTYEHVIEPNSTGAVLTERAIMSGPLAGVAARLIGKRLASTFVATTAHCAQLAESRLS